jgi:hypothetical protein
MIEKEIWKTIPDFSRYEASNLGNVRSKNYKNTGVKKNLKPSAAGNKGYLCTMLLRDDGKYNTRPIHRLVLSSFVENTHKKETINHINGIKQDNRLINLEWSTRSENCIHAVKTGLWQIKKGEEIGTSKLTKEQVLYARKLKKEKGRFWGRNELAEKWGVNAKHLQKIVNKQNSTWSHI